MNLDTHVHHQYVLDRQGRLQAEAAAHRLAAATPARTRLARFLGRAANRVDGAIASGRPRDTAAKPIVERS
jgi:hypothetical protein